MVVNISVTWLLRHDDRITITITSDDFKLLTSLTRDEFEKLYEYCAPYLRQSVNRSPRDALGILLAKLRLNVSQRMLAFLFGMPDQASVSYTISAVTQVLATHFVPKFLGFHLSRQETIEKHTTSAIQTAYQIPSTNTAAILDATYIYVDKPADLVLQKRTYSGHKYRNLVKIMVTVASDGYIIDSQGPYYADGRNNDASIFCKMLREKEGGFMSHFTTGDVIPLDRGFLKSTELAESKGFKVKMPHFLKKNEKQFSVTQANESRMVTMHRWVVEAAHGQIKNRFPMFLSNVKLPYLPKIDSLFKIAAAIQNCFGKVPFKENEKHVEFAQEALQRVDLINDLSSYLEENGMHDRRCRWPELAENYSIEGFPRLTNEDIQNLTLGSYQLKLAPRYATKTSMQLHLEKNCNGKSLVHARISSRFSSTANRKSWIQFDGEKPGLEGILGWSCSCQNGQRVLGCCCHVTAVLWYLGKCDQTQQHKTPFALHLLDAAEMFQNDDDDESSQPVDLQGIMQDASEDQDEMSEDESPEYSPLSDTLYFN